MTFLTPAILGGLAAVSIPIAIHLLNKFRVKRIDWAAMRFLADSLRKNERRVKIEDLILLLLRCLLFILLVLAFARPVLRALSSTGEGSGPVAAVVVLDNSASMQQTGGAVSRFDEARKAVREWVDQRTSDSLVGLLLVSNRTDAVVPSPVPDLARVREELGAARVSDRGTNLAQGVRQAFQILGNISGRPREIRVYTDDQTSGWEGLEEVRRLARENPGIRLVPVAVGKAESNLGVTALSVEGGVAAVNLPVRIRVEVANFGEATADGVRVSLHDGGETLLGETVLPALAPGGSQSVEMTVSFSEAGYRVLTARIPSDPLTIDNARSLAVDVVKAMNVLIVEGGEAETKVDRDAYFLANALVPVSMERSLKYYLGLTFAQPSGLTEAALAEANVVFLCNTSALPVPAAEALAAFVKRGGNLVVFPGPLSDPAQWKSSAAFWELLPAEVGPPKPAGTDGQGVNWQKSEFEHPVTALWNDAAQGSLGKVRVLRYLPLTPKPAPSGGQAPLVLVRHADGEPAALEWQIGAGRVVLFNTTATPEWGNLPLHPAFVPFMQRLLGYLNRSHETRLALSPGEPFRKAVGREFRGREFSVRAPDGNTRPAGRVETEGDDDVVRFSDTQAVGPYELFFGGESRPFAAFAVQLDPGESDLRQLDAEEWKSLTEPAPEAKSEPASQMVITREFWTPLIWLVAILALVEMALAFRFSRSH